MTDKVNLDELRALRDAANGGLGCADWFDGDDARFYEAAHRDLPALLDTIASQQREIEALKEQQIENAIYISRLQEQTMRAPEQQEAEDGR